MTDIKRISLAVLAPLMIVSMPFAGQAEDTVIKRTTIIEGTSRGTPNAASLAVITIKQYSLKFKERLKNLRQQNDTAQSKGWITADEHAKFNAEVDRLTSVEATVEAAGFPKADLDDLEKQVTKLNSDLSTASTKQPKTTATTATTTTTAKKTAAGDTKAKAKAKTTTTTKKTTAAKK